MGKFEKCMEEGQRGSGSMESYLSAMKRRLSLQMLGCFIRDGAVKVAVSNDSFQHRETKAAEKLERFLVQKCGEREADEIMEEVNTFANVEQEIYFSLGMKAGATLQYNLTDNFETDT